jgi:peptidyl-prolyl cis-trans isomerase SurA
MSDATERAMNYYRTIALAALLTAAALSGVAVHAEIIEQVLVKVNGEIFTKTDLEARQVAALRQMGQQANLRADPSDAQLRKMLDEATPQIIVSVVDEMLIVQRGRELGYTMGDDQFKSILENIKKDNHLETEEQFQAALKQENMTLADLRRNLERQMIISRVQQNEVLGKIAVSDEEARRYYDSHLNEFTSPQTVTLREVFVSLPSEATATVADDTAAREKAEGIRQRALAGESFEKLAADMSDSPSRANAGLIGPLSLSDISPELRTNLEAMKVGDVSEVLRGPRGYQILKLESKTAAETLPFAQAREEISNRVFTAKRQEEFQKYIEKMRSQAIIEWKNKDLEKAYNDGIQQMKAGVPPPPIA